MARTADIALLTLSVVPQDGFTQAPASRVREWAAENGHTVSARGAIPDDVVNEFNRVHKRRKVQFIVGSNVGQTKTYTYTDPNTNRERKFQGIESDMRDWAREQGLTVGQRGRLPKAVVTAYGVAHATPAKKRTRKGQAQAQEPQETTESE